MSCHYWHRVLLFAVVHAEQHRQGKERKEAVHHVSYIKYCGNEAVLQSIEECRQALIQLPRNGLNELPRECKEQPYIIVYRAGEEDIDQAKDRISWTLDVKTAEFFMNTWRSRHANAMYKAKIKPCDVIAFTDERKEQEVLQFRGVYDIERVS